MLSLVPTRGREAEMRKRNPFGIDTSDVLVLGGVVAILIWLTNRAKSPSDMIGDMISQAVPDSVERYFHPISTPVGGTTFVLKDITFESPVLRGATLHITWTFTHSGKGGWFKAGMKIHTGPSPIVYQTIEKEFYVDDHVEPKEYYISTTATLAVPMGFMAYGIRAYIATTDGTSLSEVIRTAALWVG